MKETAKHRQCIAADEATVAAHQHRKPCSDCPWARKALAGWLGNLTIDDWIHAAHGEAEIDCHTLLGTQCAGSAIYRANVGKLPRSRHLIVLPPNETTVFSSPAEFRKHHQKGWK